jgi:lysylphosphatidylglycerol synthetase-like protein (DUF2156 family)
VGRSAKTLDLVRIAQSMFFLNALIWLLIGVVSLIRMADGSPDRTITALVIAFLVLGNVAAMLLSGVGLGKQQKRFYYFALAVLVVNIVLTFTDEFGILDFATLIIDVVLVGIVIAARRTFFGPPTDARA